MAWTIGVDLGGTNIKIGLFDDQLALQAQHWLPTPATAPPAATLTAITAGIRTLLAAHPGPLTAIGLGIPGLVDAQRGLSLFSPNFPQWQNVPVSATLAQSFGVPVRIDNDVRVNTIGEWRQGAGRGVQDLVMLTIGTGLGAGVVVDGHMLRGATNSAGEVGHMNMFRRGRPCNCGSQGCLSRYVSAVGIVQTYQEKRAGQHLPADPAATPKTIQHAAEAGEAAAIATYQAAGTLLGYGLTNIVNMYNPSVIIIGGGVAGAGDWLLRPARQIVADHALAIPGHACRIVTAALGNTAGMRGAAQLVREEKHPK